jgi:Type IV secretion-system coupling protein DNA-binding domain
VPTTTSVGLVTESFYAWELRGRGWTVAPYPVDLEPPHRPFFVLPDGAASAAAAYDDGKRPTLISSVVDWSARLFAPAPVAPAPVEPFAEQEPFPLDADRETALVSLSVSVPPDFASDPALAIAIIRSLLHSAQPAAFEVIGLAGVVSLQFTIEENDATHVESMLLGYLPSATINRAPDLLVEQWDGARPSLVVDLGLANEFFLPIKTLRSFAVDPLIPLVAALGEAEKGETVVFQVLFQRSVNGWGKTIREALVDEHGDAVFLDAPGFTRLAGEKTSSPLVAAVVRIGVCAESSARVHRLIQSALAYSAQFERGDGNGFIPLSNDGYDDSDHVTALLRRESFRTGILLSVDELIQLVHVPDRSVRDRALLRASKREKLLPGEARGPGLCLGVNTHRGVEVQASIPREARASHVHVIGATGTGKSTLLLNLIADDIARGYGVCVLDPHGDLVDDVLARMPDDRRADVCLLDPADPDYAVGFNVLKATSEVEKNLLASDMVAIFRRHSTSWGDAMSTVLGNTVLALLESPHGGTLLTLRRFLADDRFRRDYIAVIADPYVQHFWEKEYPLIGARSLGPILTRLDQFLRPRLLREVLGQQEAKLDVGSMVEGRGIILARLAQGGIGTENAHLLGSLLLTKLHQAVLARQELPPSLRHPHYVYIDECQHFIGESVGALLSEARKFGVGFTLAHQYLGQLDGVPGVQDALRTNAHTRIMFRAGDDDAKELAAGCSFFEASDLLSLSRGEAVVRLGTSDRDFNLRVLPRDEVTQKIAEERMAEIRARSRKRFGTSRTTLADMLPSRESEKEVLKPAQEDPTSMAAPVPASPIPTALAAPPHQPAIPKRAAKPAAPPTLGRGGKEHKYLQYLVKRLAEERGFRATIEEQGEGSESVDVVLRRGELAIGVEISISTSVEHEVANLSKCAGLGFAHLLFITQEKRKRDAVARAAADVLGDCAFLALAPEDIVSALDALAAPPPAAESVVRGYTVRVSRQRITPEEALARRKAVARVIARSAKSSSA